MDLDAKFKTEEIERRLDTLPNEVADAFESERTAKIIFDAGREQGLAIDKIGEIAKLVGYAMLGLVSSVEFMPNLTEIVGDRKKAADLATVLNQQIFLPIRGVMRQAYDTDWSGDTTPGVAPTPALPPRPLMPPMARSSLLQPPPPRPAPPGPAPAPLATRPRIPEPLIIHPLPRLQRPAKAAVGESEVAPAAKTPDIAPPTTLPGRPAPIITTLGIRPTEQSPPPAASYDRAREAVEKELEVFRRGTPGSESFSLLPGTAPAEHHALPTRPSAPASPPSPHIITKEQLAREIERFRPPAADSASNVPPSTPPAPKPLKLPQDRIPKPPAPEKYTADPYKEQIG